MALAFGRYVVEAQVAAGATATVWRARHADLGRLAAIKVVSERLAADPAALSRLRHEAQQLTRLENPHIVAVYDFVDDAQPPYLVTEWVDGESLRELLERVGALTPQQALGVMRGALQGLAYAHERQLVHGDVSPSNMVLDRDGTTKLIDFGLAAPAGEPGVFGTPAYLSPEAASGQPLVPASDVYSAAAVLYQLLSGHPVFPTTDVASTIRAHQEQPAPPLTGYSRELTDLLARALAKSPQTRPSDGGQFLAQLEDAAERSYGGGWLKSASVVSLLGGGAGGAVAAVDSAAGAGAGASISAGPASTAEALTTASADTGSVPSAPAGNRSRPMQAVKQHPYVTAAVGTLAVAAVATTAVLASGSNKSSSNAQGGSKPTAQAVLLASSPRGSYVLSGVQRTAGTSRPTTLAPVSVSVTEQCDAKKCAATVLLDGKKVPFSYDGSTFFTTTTTQLGRVMCGDPLLRRLGAPGQDGTALLTTKAVWRLKVTKRAPATSGTPGRPIELVGTEAVTYAATDLQNGCRGYSNASTRGYQRQYTLRLA